MSKSFWQRWLTIGVLGAVLAFPGSAVACPSCQASLDQSVDKTSGEDPMREAKAYALSIYLMAGMPYLLLASLGFLFYRSVKKSQKAPVPANAVASDPVVPPTAGTLPT
jgi:hypothetical protein